MHVMSSVCACVCARVRVRDYLKNTYLCLWYRLHPSEASEVICLIWYWGSDSNSTGDVVIEHMQAGTHLSWTTDVILALTGQDTGDQYCQASEHTPVLFTATGDGASATQTHACVIIQRTIMQSDRHTHTHTILCIHQIHAVYSPLTSNLRQ